MGIRWGLSTFHPGWEDNSGGSTPSGEQLTAGGGRTMFFSGVATGNLPMLQPSHLTLDHFFFPHKTIRILPNRSLKCSQVLLIQNVYQQTNQV